MELKNVLIITTNFIIVIRMLAPNISFKKGHNNVKFATFLTGLEAVYTKTAIKIQRSIFKNGHGSSTRGFFKQMIRANFIPIAVRNDYSEMDTDATWGHKEHL